MSDSTPAPQKRGCFFYGCLTLIVVVLVGGLLTVLAVRYGIRKVETLAKEYTDTAPMVLEKADLPAAELKSLQDRVAAFGEALESQKSSQELVLSATDINALIAQDPNFKEAKDKLFVIIDDDRIKGKVSWPLQDIGPLKLQGRYLNGEATFKVSLQDGVLGVFLDGMVVKGKPLPPALLSHFKVTNLAEGAQRDPQAAAKLQKFDSIKIENGKVILKNKVQPQP